MQATAIGLTCKDALMIFSQNETLALQVRVSQLEKELAQFIPRSSFHEEKVTAKLLFDIIKTRFNNFHSQDTRYAPVRTESDALHPFPKINGCIWSGMRGTEYDEHSLLGIVMRELVTVLGDSSRTYCKTQCKHIFVVFIEALRAVYMCVEWRNFQKQYIQEAIIWHSLAGYLEEMVGSEISIYDENLRQ